MNSLRKAWYLAMFVLSALGPSACSECAVAGHDALPAALPVRMVLATGYCWREPGHLRLYGRHNCEGGLLDETQCAADTRFYPLGTVLWIDGLGRRVVTDRGSAVIGPAHIDLHFASLEAMRAWGSRPVGIRVLRPAR